MTSKELLGAALGLCALASSLSCASSPKPEPERTVAGDRFAENGVRGSIVVLVPSPDPAAAPTRLAIESGDDATARTLPASTFKIPNLLIGLEAGVVAPDEVFRWDGTPQAFKSWEKDLILKEAFQASCVRCFQEIARRVGLERMREQVRGLGFGNGEIGERVDAFWLEGPLAISPDEQAWLMRRIFQGEVPFAARNVALLKEAMLVEDGPEYRLYAKTGWGMRAEPNIGWYVGWVETSAGPRFFATRVLVPAARSEIMPGIRKALTLQVLRDLGLLPAAALGGTSSRQRPSP